MNFPFLSLAGAGLFALTLGACSQAPTKAAQAPGEPVKSGISEEARMALAQAEADVRMARSKFALWTTAETALKQAQEAAKVGDSATVLKQSAYASSQAQAGLAQLSYPSTEQK